MDAKHIITAMPKVELHLHLEGSFPLESLFNLINKYGGSPDIQNVEDLKQKFEFTDLTHFIETWNWKNQFYQSPNDIEEMAYSTIINLASKNIVYAEVFFSPWDFVKSEMPFNLVIEAVISGVRCAKQESPINISLIADLVRNLGHQTAMKRLNEITMYRDNVIGIGLGGNEEAFPAEWFSDVFIEAKRRGFHTVAHAGEAVGANSIWSALKYLQAERIGHGVRAIEDPVLLNYLKEKQTPLEICITSNLKLKVLSSLAIHPVRKLFDKGILITINSDDPTMFGSDLNDEFLLLFDEYNFTIPEIQQLTKNAITASFADEPLKTQLRLIHEEFWNKTNYC